MSKSLTIENVKVNVTDPNLGAGGQGRAEKAVLSDDPTTGLVVKHVPYSKDQNKRVKALVKKELPLHSPYLAAPIASKVKGDEILHLAPLAEGHDLTQDNRTFPENMELAYQLMCQLTILEEEGVVHGDLAPSNIMISDAGEVQLIDFDNATIAQSNVPPPSMVGQHMMLAPELRDNKGIRPNQMSDRYAYGVILNMLLLRRHPAGDAQTPADLADTLSTGLWPERGHVLAPGHVPVEAIGHDLMSCFDEAFLLTPHKRPSANHWREAISDAIHRLVIHDCGNAFVLDAGETHCPWCNGALTDTLPPRIQTIKINIPSLAAKYGVKLTDDKPIVLGRKNIAPKARSVSSRHLEITPKGSRIRLRHLGSNPTLMLQNGKWHQLRETWLDLSDLQTAPVTLKLADLMIDIGV